MQPETKRLQFEGVTLDKLASVVNNIIQVLDEHRVILMHGDMGAGKTTFVKEFCTAIGVIDVTSSPTFSIVNEYMTIKGDKVYHFDFYRIKKETEAYDIGVDEYFESGAYCFVEWSEKVKSLLPLQYAEVFITPVDESRRTIAFSKHD